MEFSYTGVVDQSFAGYNILIAAHRYCPISQQVSLNSGQGAVEVEAAAGGWYNVRARLAFPYGSTGVAKLVYWLDGEVLQVDSTVISCTNIAGCAIDWRLTVVFYPGMTVATGSGSILHGQSTTLSVAPVASPFFCARGGAVWHPGYPVTVSVVAGSSYGSFVDVTTGENLGTSFKRKVAQLNAVRYIANGEQPPGEQDTVRIQAEANGVMGMSSVVVRRTAPLLDHFAVRVEKDTIAFTESAKIFVQAKDANDNDVELEGSTLLRFSIDSTQYGSFVVESDTVTTKEVDVVYSKAREGSVKFIANKTNPILLGPKRVNINVQKVDDPSKRGEANIVIFEPAILKLALSQSTLRPLGDSDNKHNPNYNKDGPDKRKKIIDFSRVKTTTVTVRVTDRFLKPVPSYPFTLKALVRPNSGGHDHSSYRPTGRFIKGTDTVATVNDATGSDGRRTYTYLSSGIGGIDSLFVEGLTDKDTASAIIVLKMAEFEELRSGEKYVLVGAFGEPGVTSEHRKNHFGSSTLISKLKQMADTVHAYKNLGYRLRINDMSLQHGGPFDLNNNWDTPHQTHREGVSADIDNEVETADNGRKVITQKQLAEWARAAKAGNNIGNEGNHFHITIR